MPVEAEVLLAFWVAANSRFLNHRCSSSVWFAESARLVMPVGALNFKYPAAPWAFKHNLSGCSCWFVWCERNCRRIQR
jgi:hypothetical protein